MGWFDVPNGKKNGGLRAKQYELIRGDEFMIIVRTTHHEIVKGELRERDFPG